MAVPLLKQFGDLTPADLQSHQVWVGCHVTDYDEPWYDETDEETFRPWTGSLPIRPEQGMFLVCAEALLNDGTRLLAFVTPAHEPGDLGTLQPHVFVEERPFGFWGGIVGISEDRRVGFFESLDKQHDQVFPLVVAVTSGLARGETTAHVEDWPTRAPGMPPKPRKRFRQRRR